MGVARCDVGAAGQAVKRVAEFLPATTGLVRFDELAEWRVSGWERDDDDLRGR